jgi:hypothetical protein
VELVASHIGSSRQRGGGPIRWYQRLKPITIDSCGARFHAEQGAHRINALDEKLIQAE